MSGWTDDRIETAKRLKGEGYTLSQIGKILGVTRNAVCGKLWRIGFKGPTRPREPKAVREPARLRVTHTRVYKLRESKPLPEQRTAEVVTDPCRLVEAGNSRCTYPLGEPDADMIVCGARKERGAYCAGHAALTHSNQPLKPIKLPYEGRPKADAYRYGQEGRFRA